LWGRGETKVFIWCSGKLHFQIYEEKRKKFLDEKQRGYPRLKGEDGGGEADLRRGKVFHKKQGGANRWNFLGEKQATSRKSGQNKGGSYPLYTSVGAWQGRKFRETKSLKKK